MRSKGINNNTTNKTMTTKKAVPAKSSKKEFEAKKEAFIAKCSQAGVIQTYLTEIENTKNDEELTTLINGNVKLRPFAGG